MAKPKKGYTICNIIAYTTSGKEVKLTLTKSAKRSLIAKMKKYGSSKGVKGNVNILNKQGKVVKSLPLSSLKPYIREL